MRACRRNVRDNLFNRKTLSQTLKKKNTVRNARYFCIQQFMKKITKNEITYSVTQSLQQIILKIIKIYTEIYLRGFKMEITFFV